MKKIHEHFDTEELMAVFGKPEPTLKDFLDYFSVSWIKWKNNEVILKQRLPLEVTEKIGFLNFVRSGKVYRFKKKEDLFLVKLTYYE